LDKRQKKRKNESVRNSGSIGKKEEKKVKERKKVDQRIRKKKRKEVLKNQA